MKILPSAPSTGLNFTERKVFDLVKSVDWGPGATGLSAVNLSEHEYKRWGELDFVLVGQHGLFVIEVKGGDVSCHDGVWHYSAGGKSFSRSESPYAQVKGGFFSLETHLNRIHELELPKSLPGGFCVVFASMRRRDLKGIVGGPETPEELTGSAEDLAAPESFRRFLNRVVRYWEERTGRASPDWPTTRIRQVVNHLRPEFDRVVPLSLRMTRLREERVRLTEEQYDVLDFLEDEPRLLITGGAGCGKTFLGVEVARREHAAGRSVLFLTGTSTLAQYLRLEGSMPEEVELRSASAAVQATSLPADTYDMVIVDEGQQVTTPEMWGLLDRVLHGGAEGGRWRWFADYTRQVALDSAVDEGTLELLRLSSTHQQLIRNCRNTPELISAAEQLSGVRLGRALVKGAGPKLAWAAARSRAGVPTEAGSLLHAWLQSDISPESVVLLYASEQGRKDAIAAARAAGLDSASWGDSFRAHKRKAAAPIASINEFRGLESEYAMLFGFDDVADDAELRSLSYLGITRATFGAAIACTTPTQHRLVALSLGSKLT